MNCVLQPGFRFDFDFGSDSWFVFPCLDSRLIWSFELTFRPRCDESIHRWNFSQFISAKNFSSPRFSVLRSRNIYRLSGCIEYFDVLMFV